MFLRVSCGLPQGPSAWYYNGFGSLEGGTAGLGWTLCATFRGLNRGWIEFCSSLTAFWGDQNGAGLDLQVSSNETIPLEVTLIPHWYQPQDAYLDHLRWIVRRGSLGKRLAA